MHFWWRRGLSWQAGLLLPLSWCYRGLLACRRFAYRFGLCRRYKAPVPLVVVGNFTVGGTGKTPLVIALALFLQQQGLRVGVVSRGYGAKPPSYPFFVLPHANAVQTGDEPLLIAKHTGCPVVIDPNRPRAIQILLKQTPCDIVISDDGLQHLAMCPSIALVVVDGLRRFGNGLVLPAGPLREPLPKRKAHYLWVVNGSPQCQDEWPMQLSHASAYQVHTEAQKPLSEFKGQKVLAFAGIGHPARFFEMLREQGIEVEQHIFPDHHNYTPADFLAFNQQLLWFTTEKDMVKCKDFVRPNTWVVPVTAVLPSDFWGEFKHLMEQSESHESH